MNEAPGTDDGKPAVRQVGTRVVYENPWMVVREDEVERLDGSRGIYGVVDKPDFVLVIPVEDDGFHLVEEYRYPIGKRTWSFPQGSLPGRQDADPEELAHLELAQETGLRAGDLIHLGYLNCSHGTSGQGFNVFVASDLRAGQADREPEEQDMRQKWMSRDEFTTLVRDGRITDDSTLAAYALLLMHEAKAKAKA
ncbi:NUDIX domain-containing protein [Actinomadura chibensis]|uniref:NUDIX hydrolase n=1 Tax=Actinomadura chibensis TaxID=392828 RepID=A0A5D0NY63_9ACTN|nr:NUDIX hydrolase [Actinomadura chibensis]TYB49104.1 NUDIX hydrolase [Actinomadura chibensis]